MALLDRFTQFIQSPQAAGLAAGLLQGSTPSMTQPPSFGGAFGLGLQNMQRAQEEAEKRKLARDIFGLDQSRFSLEQQGLALKQLDAYRKYLADKAVNDELGIDTPPIPESLFFGQGSPVSQAIGQSQENEPPPVDTQDAYAVKDPRINGGRLSYLPMQDESGKKITRQEAISKVITNPELAISMAAAGEPDQGSDAAILQPEMVQQKPKGGLLANLPAEQAQWARTSKLLGGNKGLLKALDPRQKADNLKASRAFVTDNQRIIQAVDNVLPKIEELYKEDVPYQNPAYFGGKPTARLFSPQRMARYEGKVAAITDTLVGALNLPKTNESLHLVSQMVSKQPNEGDTAYRGRLKKLMEDLVRRRKNAESITPRLGSEAPVIETLNPQSPNDPLGWR